MATRDDLFLSWAAGVFEGEGSVRINAASGSNMGALLVDMVNTDPSLVLPFHERWAGYYRQVAARPPRSSYWRWRLAARQAAAMLVEIQPFLRSDRLRERVELALEYQAQKGQSSRSDRAAYVERQQDYYARMKALNVRGCA